MERVLSSVEPVVKSSAHVRINHAAIEGFCQTVSAKDFAESEFDDQTSLKSGLVDDQIGLVMVYNTVNYCYWGDPKWTITRGGNLYDGSAAMLRSLKSAIEGEFPLTYPAYLAKLPKDDLKEIFKGNIQIPLFEERLRLLRILGQTVKDKFDESFLNVIRAGKYDAEKIVEVLVKDFPRVFDDSSYFNGHKVRFYKRAQLVPAHLDELSRQDLIPFQIKNIDQLTAFADYKVPQLLRKSGILEYASDLAFKIDNQIKIPQDSDDEIEIRANTIWAVELVTQALKYKFPDLPVNAARTDGIFWFRGQVKSPDDKPYHLTRTTWY